MTNEFGNKLREHRRATGVSQRELAQKAGLDYSYISKIENGRLPAPAADTIILLCQILNIPSEEMLALTGKLPSQIQEKVGTSRAAQTFLREAQRMNLSDEEWNRVTDSLKKLRED